MQCRFIPTGVGNTLTPQLAPWANPVHPHRRGEHVVVIAVSLTTCGSSPQAWGTLPKFSSSIYHIRFIPTGVGNTFLSLAGVFLSSVHPHRRGEHSVIMHSLQLRCGSSPQAWGTHQRDGTPA